MDVLRVRIVNSRHLFQAAHPVGLFGAEQVSLAGVHAHHFSGRRDLEALGGASMRLELELLYLFLRHNRYLAEFRFTRVLDRQAASKSLHALLPHRFIHIVT